MWQATAGSLQSLCWAASAIGGVASAYFSGSLVEAWGPRGVFALTAVFPLIVSLAAALIDEQPVAAPKLKASPDARGAALNPKPQPHPEAGCRAGQWDRVGRRACDPGSTAKACHALCELSQADHGAW